MRGYLRARDRRKQRSPKGGTRHWQLVVDDGKDLDGRRHQVFRAFHGTKTEAEVALTRLVDEVERGIAASNTKIELPEYLDGWLANKQGVISASAFSRYSQIVEQHLKPALGRIRVNRVTPAHINAALMKWRNGERNDRKRGFLSPRTVHHHFVTLKAALKDAVMEGLIPRNPCDLVKAPKKGRPTVRAYTVKEALALFSALSGSPLHAPTMFAVLTGLRRGEILGLQWGDIDLERGAAEVRRALENYDDGSLHFKEPKTLKSRRFVALPARAVALLRTHREEQIRRQAILGREYQDHGLVFPAHDGQAWHPDSFSSAFYYWMANSGLPKISFHGLRHSFASIHQRAGTPLKTASDAMGHSSAILTADIYSHSIGEDLVDAARRIDAIFDTTEREHAAAAVQA